MSSPRRTHASRTRLLGAALAASLLVLGLLAGASGAQLSASEASLLRRDDRGLYVHYCPAGQEAASTASAAQASAAPSKRMRAAGVLRVELIGCTWGFGRNGSPPASLPAGLDIERGWTNGRPGGGHLEDQYR